MKFHQYYLECLSQASYLIGDETTGRAVIVDPRRDVADYAADATLAGLTIELVIETHFHADFVSGHLELAELTGAEIGYSSVASAEFPTRALEDGERINLGEVELEIRHTPGHTPDSISVVIYENANDLVPFGVLTGDTMFIGDVGRPDLLASQGISEQQLAAELYDSLHGQLLTLPDQTRVYPGHGAGSACGKNLSSELWSTIGQQRLDNHALAAPDKASFVSLVTADQQPVPGYFAFDAQVNRNLRPTLDEQQSPRPLNFADAAAAAARGAVIIDARAPEDFARAHLIGAVNVGLAGRFAETVGSLIRSGTDLILIADPGRETEAKNRLARIGFDDVIGYLAEPLDRAPRHLVSRASRLDHVQLALLAQQDEVQILDVRSLAEVDGGAIVGSINIPLGQLADRMTELDNEIPTIVYCAGGFRSSTAASLLRHAGFADVHDLIGGYEAIPAGQCSVSQSRLTQISHPQAHESRPVRARNSIVRVGRAARSHLPHQPRIAHLHRHTQWPRHPV